MDGQNFHIEDLIVAASGQMFPLERKQVTAAVFNHMTGVNLNTFELIDAAAQARPALFKQFTWLKTEAMRSRRLVRSTLKADREALDCRVADLALQYGEYHAVTPLHRYQMGRAQSFAAAMRHGRNVLQATAEPIRFEVLSGATIHKAAESMLARCRETRRPALVRLNDVELTVTSTTSVPAIVEAYVDERIKDIEFAFADPDPGRLRRARRGDIPAPFNRVVIVFTDRWARLMQAELAVGLRLEDIAERSKDEAGNGNVTTAQRAEALSLLRRIWRHGEQVHEWNCSQNQCQLRKDSRGVSRLMRRVLRLA